jgi:hypothetical protein
MVVQWSGLTGRDPLATALDAPSVEVMPKQNR